ncbi:glycosyltransferase family 2 protein [Oricola sp.]|uniref:glycosyltransferase family 2 protein n=1 Tax=Oricola sp. TaxID=1979950 RepID=UPI0025CFAC54|nr:glycosyltransferase family 2 protein [Oricola sp.]MCI5073630.1 glycosyltransferase [Oricola sp.]
MMISVVTVVFNRANVIKDALESVQRQSYRDYEHVIQDGGSTDGTLEIIESVANEKTRIESAPDGGIYDAINKGIARCRGNVVGLMHSDDFFADDDVLKRVADVMTTQDVDGVYGDLQYVSASSERKVIRHWSSGTYTRSKLRNGWMPPHPTLYLKREVFERYGLYDTELFISADYEAMMRWLYKHEIRLAYIPEVLIKMRVGGASNGSVKQLIEKSRQDLIAIRRHEIGGLRTLASKNLRKLDQFLKRPAGSGQ